MQMMCTAIRALAQVVKVRVAKEIHFLLDISLQHKTHLPNQLEEGLPHDLLNVKKRKVLENITLND